MLPLVELLVCSRVDKGLELMREELLGDGKEEVLLLTAGEVDDAPVGVTLV